MKNLLFSLLILIPYLSIPQAVANDGSWISSGSPKSATESDTETDEKTEKGENGDEEKKPEEN